MKRRPHADHLRAALERLHVEAGYALDLLGLGVLDGVDQVLHHAREVELARIAARTEATIEKHAQPAGQARHTRARPGGRRKRAAAAGGALAQVPPAAEGNGRAA